MPNNKTRKRVQSPKSANRSTRSPDAMAMILRNGDGPHKSATDYQRRPKHRTQGWGE